MTAPNGGFVTEAAGDVAEINLAAAPLTGLYRVIVGSGNTGPTPPGPTPGVYLAAGNYVINAFGVNAPPAVDLGDIAVNFTSYGLYVHANHAGTNPQWTQIHPTFRPASRAAT